MAVMTYSLVGTIPAAGHSRTRDRHLKFTNTKTNVVWRFSYFLEQHQDLALPVGTLKRQRGKLDIDAPEVSEKSSLRCTPVKTAVRCLDIVGAARRNS